MKPKWHANSNTLQTTEWHFSHHSFLTSRKTIIAYFFGSWIRIQLEYTINHTQQFVISPNTCQTLDFIVFAPDYWHREAVSRSGKHFLRAEWDQWPDTRYLHQTGCKKGWEVGLWRIRCLGCAPRNPASDAGSGSVRMAGYNPRMMRGGVTPCLSSHTCWSLFLLMMASCQLVIRNRKSWTL